MSKNIIFYFTGTGNSLKVAKDIAQALGDTTLVSMGKPYDLHNTYQHIGFIYPVYCSGMPRAVEEFVKNLDLSQNKDSYIFGISTSGASGGGLSRLQKIIASKGCKLSYGTDIKCFSNYICLYAMGNNATKKAMAQANATKAVIDKIQSHIVLTKFKDGALDFTHNKFLNMILKNGKHLSANETCNGCGTCSKVCPVGNITMQGGKPSFGDRCEQCVACIQWCPKQALNCKNKTQNRGRYHHPDINIHDIVNNR